MASLHPDTTTSQRPHVCVTPGRTLPPRGHQANGRPLLVPGLAELLHPTRRERLLVRLGMKSDRRKERSGERRRGVVGLTTAGVENQQMEETGRSAPWILEAANPSDSPELLRLSGGSSQEKWHLNQRFQDSCVFWSRQRVFVPQSCRARLVYSLRPDPGPGSGSNPFSCRACGSGLPSSAVSCLVQQVRPGLVGVATRQRHLCSPPPISRRANIVGELRTLDSHLLNPPTNVCCDLFSHKPERQPSVHGGGLRRALTLVSCWRWD